MVVTEIRLCSLQMQNHINHNQDLFKVELIKVQQYNGQRWDQRKPNFREKLFSVSLTLAVNQVYNLQMQVLLKLKGRFLKVLLKLNS